METLKVAFAKTPAEANDLYRSTPFGTAIFLGSTYVGTRLISDLKRDQRLRAEYDRRRAQKCR